MIYERNANLPHFIRQPSPNAAAYKYQNAAPIRFWRCGYFHKHSADGRVNVWAAGRHFHKNA